MPSGTLRQPRAYLLLAGKQCVPVNVSVSMTSQRSADTFGATVALDADPDLDEQFFADTAKISFEVMMTNDQVAGEWVKMLTGFVDTPAINFAARTCHIAGRDKSSLLLEKKTTEKWLNKTSSEVVKEIAGRVGLTADVIVPAADKVGLITADDYNRISEEDTLWNILCVLAEREHCAMFVKGDRLVFKPYDQLGGSDVTVTYQRPTRQSFADGTFTNLTAKRNLSIAKDVKVTVKTWQNRQKKAVMSAFRSKGASTDKVDYSYTMPNATKEQLDKVAKNRLKDITNQERVLDLDIPGDVKITPENTLTLTGTNTKFDQSYIISTTSHEMSQESGFRMKISTRSPDKANTITQES